MRHTATMLIGQDLKQFTARLGKYILKYGEANASSYFTSVTWSFTDGKTEIKKAVKDGGNSFDFVSTMMDMYNTKLNELETLTGADRVLDMQHFFQKLLYQKTLIVFALHFYLFHYILQFFQKHLNFLVRFVMFLHYLLNFL